MTTLKRPGDRDLALSPKKIKSDIKPALPKELTKLFQPLYCQLCKSQLSSPLTAATHYSGKPHQKKVKQHLSEHFPEMVSLTDEISKKSKQPNNDIQNVTTPLTPDQAACCRICNVVFAGPIAAQSHYVGKKHRIKALKGYTPIEPVAGMDVGEDPLGRFGIGTDFVKTAVIPIPDEKTVEHKRTIQRWYCDICDLQATDDSQYQQHLSGKKHLKNCKKLNLVVPSQSATNVKDSILSSVSKGSKPIREDFSIHRTPSGQYFCKICNLALNSEDQFSQHIESKKHKRKKLCATEDKV